jgi:hypothetical protein
MLQTTIPQSFSGGVYDRNRRNHCGDQTGLIVRPMSVVNVFTFPTEAALAFPGSFLFHDCGVSIGLIAIMFQLRARLVRMVASAPLCE